MIQSLQSLRGVFALMIFLHHCKLYGQPAFEAGGDCGVAFFIILSGFVLSAGYYDRVLAPNFRIGQFIKKRVTRLYPLHIVGFVVWAVFFGIVDPIPIMSSISNLLLIQAWIPSGDYYFSCNSVSWCLSVLLFCYLVFPYLVKAIDKSSTKRLILCAIAILSLYGAVICALPARLILPILYISPMMRIIDFVIGILLYKTYIAFNCNSHRYSNLIKERYASILQIALIGLTAAAIALYDYIPMRLSLASYWWLPCGVLIIGFSITDGKHTFIGRLLSNRYLRWFGEISFNFYILHQLIIRGWTELASRYDLPNETFLTTALLFVASVAFSLATDLTIRFIQKGNIKKMLKGLYLA